MIIFIAVVAAISIYELRALIKSKLKKEIAVFSVLAVLTLLLGCFYIANPDRNSIAYNLFHLIGLEM